MRRISRLLAAGATAFGVFTGVLVTTGGVGAAPASPIFISEIVPANATGLQDEDATFQDWFEIFNNGTSSVDLAGWTATDSAGTPAKWVFPARTVAPGGRLVIFASSKNRAGATGNLHTNFGLAGGGEYLGLYNASGTLVHDYAPGFPAMANDVSYGINDAGDVRFFAVPTPGAANGPGLPPLSSSVTSSVARGFYTAPISAALSTTTPGATIRYTVDGSEPSDTNGTVYTSPVGISQTTTLRAASFAAGFSRSVIGTWTYIYTASVIAQTNGIPGFPNGRLKSVGPGASVPDDTEMDPAVTQNPLYQAQMDASLRAIPTMSITSPVSAIFGPDGFYDSNVIEKPVSLEVLYPNTPTANQQINAGGESHSHDRLKRSLRINFRAAYGQSAMNSDFLNRAPLNGTGATTGIRTLVLRAGNNRAWSRAFNPDRTDFTLDQFYRDSQLAMSGYGARGTFVHLYLNGVYYGLYNPVERPDDDFAASYTGGSDSDYFFVNHDGATKGDVSRWSTLTTVLVNRDQSIPANYAEFQTYLDTTAFADYLLLAFFFGITDWPTNNWYANMRNTPTPQPARYYAWDGEWSMDRKQGSTVQGAWVHPDFLPGSVATSNLAKLWRAAWTSPTFRSTFAARFTLHTGAGGALSDSVALARYQTLNNFVNQAVISESARWGDSLASHGDPLRTRDVDWQNAVNAIQGILNGNVARLRTALVAAGYISSEVPPEISPNGGTFTATTPVTITNPNGTGTIRYTLDGSDPTAAGNLASLTYTGPFNLSSNTVVRAAVQIGAAFTPSTSAAFTFPSFVVTELHYNPVPDGATISDSLEFVELQNVSNASLDASKLSFTLGITAVAGSGSGTVAPGGRVVVVTNEPAFRARYGSTPVVVQTYTGNLSNGGERIVGQYNGVSFTDFTYDDIAPWPLTPDGAGPSLIRNEPFTDPNLASSWSASLALHGTPGAGGSGTAPTTTTTSTSTSTTSTTTSTTTTTLPTTTTTLEPTSTTTTTLPTTTTTLPTTTTTLPTTTSTTTSTTTTTLPTTTTTLEPTTTTTLPTTTTTTTLPTTTTTTTLPTTTTTLPTTTTTLPVGTDQLVMSLSSNRSAPIPLNGATLPTGASRYIFLTATTPGQSVRFLLNGVGVRTETLAPWDMGGGSLTVASPYLLPQAPGVYVITAVRTNLNLSTTTFTATITVGAGGTTTSTTTPSTTSTSTSTTSTTTPTTSTTTTTSTTVPGASSTSTTSTTSTTTPSTTTTSTSTTTLPAGTDQLMVSLSSTRSPAVALNGAILPGGSVRYVFLTSNSPGTSVRFFLNGVLARTEGTAPWDYAGGSVTVASGYAVPRVPGTYVITAIRTNPNLSNTTFTATYTVS